MGFSITKETVGRKEKVSIEIKPQSSSYQYT